MSHPVRTTLAGLAVATTLVGLSACGSSSSASTSTSTSTSVAASAPTQNASTPAASDSSAMTTSADSTSPMAGASGSSSMAASTNPSMSGVPSAATLFDDARRSALAASSAHAKGQVVGDGVTSVLDMVGRTDSSNQLETFQKDSMDKKNSTGRLTLLTVGGKYWIRGDRTALSKYAGGANAARIGSKWVEVPTTRGQDLARDYGLKELIQGLFKETSANDDSDINATTKVTLTDIDGKPAYRLAATDEDFSMWVSTDADHHLMRMGGTKIGHIDFTEWNSAPLQKAPAASEVYHA